MCIISPSHKKVSTPMTGIMSRTFIHVGMVDVRAVTIAGFLVVAQRTSRTHSQEEKCNIIMQCAQDECIAKHTYSLTRGRQKGLKYGVASHIGRAHVVALPVPRARSTQNLRKHFSMRPFLRPSSWPATSSENTLWGLYARFHCAPVFVAQDYRILNFPPSFLVAGWCTTSLHCSRVHLAYDAVNDDDDDGGHSKGLV